MITIAQLRRITQGSTILCYLCESPQPMLAKFLLRSFIEILFSKSVNSQRMVL